MTSRRVLSLVAVAALSVAACGDSTSPEELPFTAEQTPSTAAPLLSEVSEPIDSVVDPTPSTTVAGAPTTTSPAPAPTIEPGPVVDPASCAGTRYRVIVPDGWHHRDCDQFSPAPIPANPGAREWRSEITAHFTTAETFTEALARINATMDVDTSVQTTVDGLPAVRIRILEEFWMSGARDTIVVDAGDGVLFIAADELADSDANTLFATTAERFAHTVAAFDEMMSSIQIDARPVAARAAFATGCAAPSFSNPDVVASGSADVDADGEIELLQMVHDDAGAWVVIDDPTSGVISGMVKSWYSTRIDGMFDQIGWHDWNADGVPELIHSADGPASGTYSAAVTVDGCNIVPIVDQATGFEVGILNRASVRYAHQAECFFNADGTLDVLQNVATEFDENTGTPSLDIVHSTYGAGATIAGSTSNDPTDVRVAPAHLSTSCVIEAFGQ